MPTPEPAAKPVPPAKPAYEPPRDWDAVYAASPDYHFGEEPSQIARAAARWFQSLGGTPKTARALDLGCGEGRDTAFLAGLGLSVTARDVSPAGLAKARALLARRGVPEGRVRWERGDARAFPDPPDSYDLALAANVFQFLPPRDAPACLERLKAATKPGGVCAVGVFSPAMAAWGAKVGGFWTQTAGDLVARFPASEGWLLLDRTEYWTYRQQEDTMASFAYVVARKAEKASSEKLSGDDK